MNLKNNELYLNRCKKYFSSYYDDFLKKLNEKPTKSFFINSLKGNDILKDIDIEFKPSSINPNAYYYDEKAISNTKAYDLGLIYPQGIESSLSSYLFDGKDINIIVDMCSAPGGKSINFINKYKDALLISNDINYKRQLLTANNFERLGIDNAIVCSLDTTVLSNKLKESVDLVILDAPCSGEGMARKTDEIFDAYSDNEIDKLKNIQSKLLEEAYNMLNGDSYLIYSTCAFSFEEDENQVEEFLKRHNDISLINIDIENNQSVLKGTVKLSFLNDTEGQFISIFHKSGIKNSVRLPLLKPINNSLVDGFINENLNIDNYYLYRYEDRFYLSFKEMIDLKCNVIRNGIYLGDLVKNRFEPNHFMYRANSLNHMYKYEIELNDSDYQSFIRGLEIKQEGLENKYYHLTHKGYSVGFGKYSNGVIKNKYPKGLRK